MFCLDKIKYEHLAILSARQGVWKGKSLTTAALYSPEIHRQPWKGRWARGANFYTVGW